MHGVEMLRPWKSGKQARAIGLKEAAARIKAHAPWGFAFFLFSLAQSLTVPSPFAVSCLVALRAAGLPCPGAAAGLAAGLIFRAAWGQMLDIGLLLACGLALLLIRAPQDAGPRLYLLTAGLLVLRSVPLLIGAPDAQTMLLAGVGAALGLAVMPGLTRCAQLIRRKPREWTEDDGMCLLLPAVLLIAGAARLSAFSVNLGCMAASAGALTLAWLAGGAAGVCVGLGCGLALLLSGLGTLPLVILAFGGLTAGMFQGKNRLLPVGVFLLSALTFTYLIAFSFQRAAFFPAVAGGAVFLMLPGKWLRRMTAWVRMIRWNQPRENAYTRLKMQRWVRAIDRMAEALPHPRMEAPTREEESEGLTEALCAGCDRLPICWHDQFDQTRQGMLALAGRGEDMENDLAVINQFFSACPRISRIPPLLNRLHDDRQSRDHRAMCADYEREMLQTHLTALSQAAQRISLEGGQADEEESFWMSQADEALEAVRFPGKTAFVKRVDGRMTVCLKCDSLALRPLTGMTLAKQVGTYLNVDLEVTERQSSRVILEERPPLKVLTGMATACAVTLDRKNTPGQTPDNGDAVLVEPLSGGKMVLALSDGMGHGAGAQDESRKTLEMLSLCLEAGYTRAQAMTAVNGAMLSATGGEKFATVDLCLIDLWTGEAALNKMGACASILVQGQKSQWIEGEALPLGIIERVTPMEHHFTLGEGDLLLLMSDGITDAFPAEEDILSIVKQYRADTAQHLADALLREAVMRKDGLPPDDMTVLCARITERKKE
ncbi:MAG: SpoIIE family protein phosphatase [Clostridia bacterium]|nr:SpoIIE family protein phosphatase [Clostridia bacterium]